MKTNPNPYLTQTLSLQHQSIFVLVTNQYHAYAPSKQIVFFPISPVVSVAPNTCVEPVVPLPVLPVTGVLVPLDGLPPILDKVALEEVTELVPTVPAVLLNVTKVPVDTDPVVTELDDPVDTLAEVVPLEVPVLLPGVPVEDVVVAATVDASVLTEPVVAVAVEPVADVPADVGTVVITVPDVELPSVTDVIGALVLVPVNPEVDAELPVPTVSVPVVPVAKVVVAVSKTSIM